MIWPDPTHQPTHPPTHSPNHAPIHEWGIFHRFQIFKQNWNILISSSVIDFWLILGVPLGGGRWVDLGRGGYGSVERCAMHTCIHTHTHAICQQPFVISIHAFACVCMHVRMCGDKTPMPPDTTPPTCPLPRATRSPKHQNSIILVPLKIFWFCLKILYLWTFLNSYNNSWSPQTSPTHLPQPQSWGNPN